MNFYKTKSNAIEKYKVSFDKERLEELKLEIINNCSTIYHREYIGCIDPYVYDPLTIRNINKNRLKQDELEKRLNIETYLISYDEYVYPKLVNIIDRIINGYSSAIDELYNTPAPKEAYEDSLKTICNKLNEMENMNDKDKHIALKEVKKYLNFIELNKKQIDVSLYYPLVQDEISLELIDTLPLEAFDRVNEFLEYHIEPPIFTKTNRHK